MITVDREAARVSFNDQWEGTPITEVELDMFIEHIELYAFSERMYEDYYDWIESHRKI